MALPNGTISASQVNVELGRPATQAISLNDSAVRGLSGQGSGAVSFQALQGKSAWTANLTPQSGNANGKASQFNFSVSCNAPAGATFSWSIQNQIYTWVILSGQGTSSISFRVQNVEASAVAESDVVCTVTYQGVSKSFSGHWVYTNTNFS